ncbi:MAG TPA: alpha/beta hydrolase [Methanoregulaceae archaeon]|nr:alpha/beta hydrolase [Methanoregulaceae archaeon]
MKKVAIPALFLLLLSLAAGCTDTGELKRQYTVDDSGILSLQCGEYRVTEKIISSSENITLEKVIFHTVDGDVYALLAAPDHPRAGFVLAPGAGVVKEKHSERARKYAESGYAFLVLDLRESGGETAGYPFSPDDDFRRFQEGECPQFYLSVCDVCRAGHYLKDEYSIPIYAMGSSNGGRYAAVATAIDHVFSGYIGVSTSGFGLVGNQYSGDARLFLLSIDPDTYVAMISPRSSWIFHSPADSVIPYEQGLELYNRTGEPRMFVSFIGSHGLNDNVDQKIISECTQIYGIQS